MRRFLLPLTLLPMPAATWAQSRLDDIVAHGTLRVVLTRDYPTVRLRGIGVSAVARPRAPAICRPVAASCDGERHMAPHVGVLLGALIA
jgi:hypothetical protein